MRDGNKPEITAGIQIRSVPRQQWNPDIENNHLQNRCPTKTIFAQSAAGSRHCCLRSLGNLLGLRSKAAISRASVRYFGAPSPAIDLPLWDHIPPALAARRIVETLKGFQFSCQAVRNCFRRVC